MSAFTFEQIADIQQATLPVLDKDNVTDLASSLRGYTAYTTLMNKESETQNSGRAIRVNALTTGSGNATFNKINQVLQPSFSDGLANGEIPWRQWWTNFTYNLTEEDVNSGDPSRIVNLLSVRKGQAILDEAELFEPAFWSKPADSTDVTTMYGLGCYIVKNSSTGFNGGNPSGFTSGIVFDSTVQTNWKNYTGQYVNVTQSDFTTLLRGALEYTNFTSPIDIKEIRNQKISRGLYTGYGVYASLVNQATFQNQNIGPDIAKYEGMVLVEGTPITKVPKLESDAQNPIYGVNWTDLHMCYLKNWKGNWEAPEKIPNVPHGVNTLRQNIGNVVCRNRRSQLVLNIA